MNPPKFPFYTPVDEALFENRIIQISGPVTSELAYEVNGKLLALDKASNKPIYLYIDSPGGEVNSGFSIFDTARFVSSDVYTVVVGFAASMGSMIALCADKDKRYAFPNSKFLIHQPLISGTFYGSASDVEIRAKDILRTKERIVQIYAEETGKSPQEIHKAIDRDNMMTAEEARQFGLISKIIRSRDELK